ncbi:MFS transporter TsgA [Sodalis-like secondary symbiont of Drepanosiphum platanoidis]|uniref:MFS transporter TsgA n=1 Tax=Sodalis-like secondary symbiont of Drepanosiphum platanoidis TaxID=2994493 RepID=UPI003463EF80
MNKNNLLKLTWISFLSYGLTGALVIVTGIILENVANYFNLSISKMSNTFTFLNAGILTAIFINSWLMEKISLKKELIFGFILMVVSTINLILAKNLILFSISMFIFGLVSGITMSIGTYLITILYKGKIRGSKLLLTDSFFSMAGTLFPILGGIFISHHIQWYWIYICITLIYFIIFILTIFSDFSFIEKKNKIKLKFIFSFKEKLGFPIILLSISALCYILGQLSLISWLPLYVTSQFNVKMEYSSRLVSYFWTSYMIGMWVFSILLRYFNLQYTITILTAISSYIIYLLINSTNLCMFPSYLCFLGFFSSSIYTTIITLGSQQTKVVSPIIVNMILIFGTIGTMLTFIITGPFVYNFGIKSALYISNILYIIVFLLCLTLGFFSYYKINK